MRSLAMSVQFAVLASGSRGNSTLVRGRGAGLLIDVGIGPKMIGQRLESVGATWSRIAAVVLTHTHRDHVDTGAFAEMARRRVVSSLPRRAQAGPERRRGIPKTRGSRLDPTVRSRSVPDLDRPAARADRASPRRRTDFRLSHRGLVGRRQRPVSIGYLADTGTWSEAMAESLADVDVLGVEFNHDVALQKSSPRPEFLDRAKPERPRSPLERQGADLVQAVLTRSRDGALRHVVLLAPERTVQSTGSGDPGRRRRHQRSRAARPGSCRAAEPCISQSLGRTRREPATAAARHRTEPMPRKTSPNARPQNA